MTKPRANQYITVCCPRCEIIIERVTAETMVYCIACRKWCREVGEASLAAVSSAPRVRKPRRLRCH
jgi:hypothetical protein